MRAPITPDDDTTRWFDEEFASTIRPAHEPNPMSFESYLERLEHQDLVASFRRNRSARVVADGLAVAQLPLARDE